MKIGIVCYPTYGGSGVVATELGKALAAKGHQVHFITYSVPVRLGSLRKNISYHEVSVSDYPLFDYQPYELVLTSKMVDVVKNEELDLLHVHYAIPHASAAVMAKQILASQGVNIPIVTTLHGTDITLVGRDASFEPVITFAINNSDAVTAVSESLRQDTFNHFAVDREIDVIPNFINLNRYRMADDVEELRSAYAEPGEFIITHISNFRPVKRVDDVVRVFDRIRKQIPARLLLVGDGPERYRVEQLCRELGACNQVKVLGKLKSTEQVLSISDLFLLTSETESFGLAALESMACGVPVISTNTGGTPEVNQHNVSGFLARVGDVDAMADYAIGLLSSPKQLKRFGKQARKRAEDFDVDNVLHQYERLYESVMEKVELAPKKTLTS